MRLSLVLLAALCATCAGSQVFAHDYFKITVVDDQTKRGVPLVEVRTTNEIRYYTDSNGVVAFLEPGLMDQNVFFTLKSHGYEFAADGFGTRGKALRTTPGKEATLEIKRINIAERLYRVTGQGIYRDSLLTNTPVQTSQPALNAQVMGQDTVDCVPYQGKLFWLWGDTGKPSYPLGNFSTTCATSDLPRQGGLDPSRGVNLRYFMNDEGFTKRMVPLEEPGPVWLGALITLPDETGRERLVAHFTRVKDLMAAQEVGLVIFNDEKQIFERLVNFDLKGPLRTGYSHAFRHTDNGVDYIYFATPYPSLRVRADLAHLKDEKTYEAYTCLKPGSRYDKKNPPFNRDTNGKLIYGWQPNTDRVGPGEQHDLEEAKLLKPDEGYWQLRDVESNKRVLAHAGSVYWNEFRKRWVMVFHEVKGTSLLGEVWYAEAQAPIGPWTTARKIVTHDNYSFYNVKHHPYFDQEGGRVIYFEGTYTTFLTGNQDPTPRYDYNQIMYRLDLSDPRLHAKGE